MEASEQRDLMNELLKGKECARRLRTSLDRTYNPVVDNLADQIIRCFENATFILKQNELEGDTYSPASFPESQGSGENFSPTRRDEERNDLSKKRKSLPKRTEKVYVGDGVGLEGNPNDGYIWRKYGQKNILGCKHPRGYFRCTHSKSHNCLATKQVQRCDDDSAYFDINYCGEHTCHHAQPLNQAVNEQETQQPVASEVLLSFQTGVKLQTQEHESREISSSSFYLPTTLQRQISNENHIFSTIVNSGFTDNFFPFISSNSPESTYISTSSFPENDNSYIGIYNPRSSEHDLTIHPLPIDLQFTKCDAPELQPTFPHWQ